MFVVVYVDHPYYGIPYQGPYQGSCNIPHQGPYQGSYGIPYQGPYYANPYQGPYNCKRSMNIDEGELAIPAKIKISEKQPIIPTAERQSSQPLSTGMASEVSDIIKVAKKKATKQKKEKKNLAGDTASPGMAEKKPSSTKSKGNVQGPLSLPTDSASELKITKVVKSKTTKSKKRNPAGNVASPEISEKRSPSSAKSKGNVKEPPPSDSAPQLKIKGVKNKTTKAKKKTSTENTTAPSSPDRILIDHPYCVPSPEEVPVIKTAGPSKEKVVKPPQKVQQKQVDTKKMMVKPKQTVVKPKKTKSDALQSSSPMKQSSITEHFQVRRSERRCPSYVKEERKLAMEKRILSGDEDSLEVREVENKGRAVFARSAFQRGDLICEYYGELLDYGVAKERETAYSLTPEVGCYMYFFNHNDKKYCVDATAESERLGRLLNHSKTKSNVCTQVFPIKDKPHLILVAARDISEGEELVYDYGDRNKASVESHPWLLT